MAWNNGFPVNYPQMYVPQPVTPYQQQPIQPAAQMPVANQQISQMMTPPTIRAEIVQIENEAAAEKYPVGAGASQMMISKDESAIFIKTATANGQTTMDVYEKRPPAPPTPVFDPGEYVRKDEIETLVSAALAAQTAKKAPVVAKRAAKEEDA